LSSLTIAGSQLAVVQSLISAIKAADKAASRASELPGGPSPQSSSPSVEHPTPQIAPRPIFHPTPTYAPRPVIHPEPRVAATAPPPPLPPVPWAAKPHFNESAPAFPPVWKILPLPIHDVLPPHFKKVPPHPDILHKGLLIDIFV
jgi:hypothetical protein